MLFSLQTFRVYLLSDKPFMVHKDQQTLQTAFKKKDIHGRLSRWMDMMTEYDFEIKYEPGKAYGAAEYLSPKPIKENDASRGENEATIQLDDP